MLDETRIERLLMELRKAHDALTEAAVVYEDVCAAHEYTVNRTLSEVVYDSKLAKEREVEAQIALYHSPEVAEYAQIRREADVALGKAKAGLEIAREAISLWRALAYQSGGHA